MRRVGFRSAAIVVVAAFTVGIGSSMVLGYWSTVSAKIPTTIAEGAFAGSYNPADIRGSYSFADIEHSFAVPATALARAFGVSETNDPGSFQAKSLEDMYEPQADGGEIGTDSVRLFTALYAGLPYVPADTTRLPESAVMVLGDRLSKADIEWLRSIAVPGAPTGSDEEPAGEHATDEVEVRGRTTFGELLDWGLTKEEIEETLGMQMGNRTETVRDVVTEAGLEFSELSEAFERLLSERRGE